MHAVGFQSAGKAGEVVAVGHGGVHEGLQAAFCRGLPRPLHLRQFAPCGRFFGGFSAWLHAVQVVALLHLSGVLLLLGVVLAVAHHVAAYRDAAGDDVYMVVLSVRMPHDDGLTVLHAHRLQVALPDGSPLVGVELVLRRCADAGVQDGTAKRGAQCTHSAKLCRQLARRGACHVGV